MKKYLLSVITVAMAIGFTASSLKKEAKLLTPNTYYFISRKNGLNSSTGSCEITTSTSDADRIQLAANWDPVDQGYTLATGNYLAAIIFDEGTGSSQLTLQQAIDGLKNYFNASGSLPTTDQVTIQVSNGTNLVTVTLRTKNTCNQ